MLKYKQSVMKMMHLHHEDAVSFSELMLTLQAVLPLRGWGGDHRGHWAVGCAGKKGVPFQTMVRGNGADLQNWSF